MAVNGFRIGFLLALTMVIIFLKFVRVFTPTPTTILPPAVEMVDRRDQILQGIGVGGLEGAATDYGVRYHLFR